MVYSAHTTPSCQPNRVRQLIGRFVAENARLEATTQPGHLRKLGATLGVQSILTRSMPSRQDKHPGIDAMLVPLPAGYSVVIDQNAPDSRQRYSLAHELAHIMLLELDPASEDLPKAPRFRSAAAEDKAWQTEERLCDEIAAELLMPERLFSSELARLGNSLKHLPQLASLFRTSLTATAIRYWELLPEPCQLLRWRPVETRGQQLKPAWQMRNKAPGLSIYPITASSIARRNEFSAVRENWQDLRTLFSYECLLAKHKAGDEPYILPLAFEAEHIGFGSPVNRTIISAVYLDPNLCN